MNTSPPCTLCAGADSYPLACGERLYHRCRRCGLVSLDPALYLDETAEKAVYDLHRNLPDDPGYRHFLSRALAPVLQYCPPPASGLDFGCGPGPALVAMAREAGYAMSLYDKFYAPDPAPLQQCYDFVTCTEVAEHLSRPWRVLSELWRCVRPGGLLVIQTRRVLDDERFRNWFYRRDPTHITFFAESSFRWLADQLQAELSLSAADVAVLRRAC